MMFFGGGMFILWLFILLGIVAAFVGLSGFAARNRQTNSNSPEQSQAKETPEEILRTRYARGEISQAEYLEMKNTLRS